MIRPRFRESDSEPAAPGSVAQFFVGLVATFVATTALSLAAIAIAVVVLAGWDAAALTSGSMSPVLRAGDIVIAQPSDGLGLGPGTIVVFEDPTRTGRVTHRIVAVNPDETYTTKGDANPRLDSTPLHPDGVIGVGRVVVPFVGLPMAWWLNEAWIKLAASVLIAMATLWLSRWGLLERFDPWLNGAPRRVTVSSRPTLNGSRAILVIGAVLLPTIIWGTVGPARAGFNDSTANGGSTLGAGDWYRFTSVSAGRQFACASNLNDDVWCWGKGGDGQLGDGTGSDSVDAVRVVGSGGSGYLLGITEVAAGETFACGLEDDGTVWCWGRNDKGQLGNNTTTSSDYPVQVVGVGGTGYLTGVVDIAAGQQHACAVTSGGSAYCWGVNDVGQLGDNTGSNSKIPVQVSGVGGSGTLSGLTAIGSGKDHACAVGSGGAIYCWGEGSDGELGNGATSDRDYPVQVVDVGGSGTLLGMETVDGGDVHTCAKSTIGAMYCWGKNDNDQLSPGSSEGSGDGTVIWKNSGDSTPDQAVYTAGSPLGSSVNMASTGDWRIIQGAASADGSEAIVLGVDGSEDISVQIWKGSVWSEPSFNPLDSVTDSYWWGFDVAYESQSGDAVMVWNNGSTGTTGISYRVWNGSTWSSESTITTPLTGEPKQMQLAAAPDSDEMVLIVSNSAGNNYAFVWNGSSWGTSTILHNGTDNLVEINVAYEQSSGDAMLVYGKLSDEMYYRIWNGSSMSGETAITVPTGTSTSSSSGWSTIASDPNSDRIVLGVHNQVNDGWVAVWTGSAWGSKLTVTTAGSGTNHPWMAVAFEGLSGDALVAYGESSRYVRYRTWPSGGSWGSEYSGPDMGSSEYPNSIMLYPRAGSNQIMLTAQDDDSDLELYPWTGSAWGSYVQPTTDTGETKNQPFIFFWDMIGSTGPPPSPPSSSSSPLPVAGPGGSGLMSGVEHIATGTTFSCASLTSGAAYCWGRNDKGQLGDNTKTNRTVPTQVVGSGGSGTLSHAGILSGSHSSGTFTCSTRTDPSLAASPARHDEEVWCWGVNGSGELGDGTKTDRSYPVRVAGI